MFILNYQFSDSTTNVYTSLREVLGLFTEVEPLVRLHLVVPVSSFEGERGFSALRGLRMQKGRTK